MYFRLVHIQSDEDEMKKKSKWLFLYNYLDYWLSFSLHLPLDVIDIRFPPLQYKLQVWKQLKSMFHVSDV